MTRQMLDVYRGILFHNQVFEQGNGENIVYDFDCPEFAELREKYDLLSIAGKGSDFHRAKRLLHNLAPRLTHSTWYDNHIQYNSLRLLEYSLDNPNHGINCLNKSKILVECCLAIGVYARRVSIMPFSPYDFDNHVVAEIYDRALEKWIMLDPTTDGYFIDERKMPLSLLEMRSKFANGEFVTYIPSVTSMRDLHKLRDKHMDKNMYICKNLFYFRVERFSTFGEKMEYLYFAPEHYSVKRTLQANLNYRIKNLPVEHSGLRNRLEQRLLQAGESQEPQRTDIRVLQKSPF